MLTPWVGREAEDFADGLTGRPLDDAELAELVAFADELERAGTVQPSPVFTSTLREALMAEASEVLVREPVATRRRPVAVPARRRRMTAAITAVIVAGGGVSLAATSASALPGDMLYPVKRSLESAQVVLHRGDADRATYDLQRATERLSEATALVDRGGVSADVVAATLDDFTALTQQGTDRAFEHAAQDQEVLEQVAEFAEASAAGLTSITGLVPTDATASHTTAIDAVSGLRGRLDVLCASCGDVSHDALDDLRRSVEQVARQTPAPSEPTEQDRSGDRSPGTQGSTSPDADSGSTEPQRPSAEEPTPPADQRPSTPGSNAPQPEEASPEAPPTGGLLDPVTSLLFGDPEDPRLLGGLLRR